MKKGFLYFKMVRPGTLAACISPIAVGLWVAQQEVKINIPTALLTFFTAACIQIMSNLVNDYFDYKRGNDGDERLGPIRAVSAGLVSVETLLRFIGITTLFALLGGIGLIYTGGWVILAIGVSALLFAVLYSATPYSLSHLGIADLFVLLYYGPIASVGTTYLQTQQFSPSSFLWGTMCGVISIAVLVVNNIRDYAQDKQHGKKTLIVRMGLTLGKIYYSTLIFLPVFILCCYASLLQGMLQGLLGIGLLGLFLKSNGKAYNRVLILTGIYNLLFASNLLLL